MVVKPEQDRVRTLLTDTVTLLCKNGLTFSKEMKVQGTLGITLDENDVLLIHINEVFAEVAKEIPTIDFPASLMLDNNSESTSSKKRRKRRGSRDSESGSATPSKRNRDTNSHESHEVRVKEEKQEDVICLEDNDEADIKPHPLREASFSSFAQMDQNNQQYSSGMLQQSQNSVPSQMSDNSNASWDGSSSSQLPHMTPYKGVPGMQGGTPGSGEPWNAADPNVSTASTQPAGGGGGGTGKTRGRGGGAILGDHFCPYPGCGRRYVQKCSLLFHQTQKHGRQKVCDRRRHGTSESGLEKVTDMMLSSLSSQPSSSAAVPLPPLSTTTTTTVLGRHVSTIDTTPLTTDPLPQMSPHQQAPDELARVVVDQEQQQQQQQHPPPSPQQLTSYTPNYPHWDQQPLYPQAQPHHLNLPPPPSSEHSPNNTSSAPQQYNRHW